MRAYSRSMLLVTVTVVVTVAPAIAAKSTFRYEAAQRLIKACVLYVDQDPDPLVDDFRNANPYLIEGLRRSSYCPDDWEFENPLAEPAAVLGRPGYVVKGSPGYWRVNLTDDTAPQLVGFDLIYICVPALNIPSPIQQDGLVRAVEHGALLWVENDTGSGGTVMGQFAPPYSLAPPAPPFVFATGTENANNARLILDATHGILTEPFKLTARDVRGLGDLPNSTPTGTIGDPTDDYVSSFPADIFSTVVQVTDGTDVWPNIMAASFGSGSIVLTASGVGSDVSEWVNPATRAGRNAPSPQQAPDVKLALNMIQWTDRWEQARRQPRAGAVSVARAPFPLDIAWQYPGPTEPKALPDCLGEVVCSPVYGRGMVYAVSLTSGGAAGDPVRPAMLMCFDADPEQDLDGDGRPGDGATDYSVGKPHDMIWSAPLSAIQANPSPRFSSPTLGTINVRDATDSFWVPVQVVLVSAVDTVNGTGSVACYNTTIDPGILNVLPAAFPATGQPMWTYNVPAYGDPGPARIICVSTPTVHRGFVYVLASEYDNTLAVGVEGTYGRAHCFDLATGGTTARWQYPSPEDDLDRDGTPHDPEDQRSLPAFNEPAWVCNPATALPPERGAIPVVSSIADRGDGIGADAVLMFGTLVTHDFNGTNVQIAPGEGSEFALIPTPVDAAGNVMVNQEYFRVRLNNPDPSAPSATVRRDDTSIAIPAPAVPPPPGPRIDGRDVVYYPLSVREMMACKSVAGGSNDPIELQTGAQVLITYDYNAGTQTATDEQHWLAGPVRWKRRFGLGEQRISEGSAGVSEVIVTTDPFDPVATGGSGKVYALDGNSREEARVKWTYDPGRASPVPTSWIQAPTSPAYEGDTAIVGATCAEYDPVGGAVTAMTSSVIGLARQTDSSVRLRGDAGTLDSYGVAISEARPFVVTLKATGVVIDPTCYRVDRVSRYLIFPADKASNVTDTTPPPVGPIPLGPIYGQAIEVEWWDDSGTPEDPADDDQNLAGDDLHVVPGLERFYHISGHIRLRNYPVDWTVGNEPTVTLLDGTPVDAGSFVAVRLTPDNLAVDGWVDMRPATVGGSPVAPGTEVLVSYTGYSEQYGMFITVPNAALNLPQERHQIPIEFGPSASAPAVAGATVHLGTAGLDRDWDNAFDDPAGPAGIADTLLSLIWDKATGLVRSALSRPSEHDVSYDPTIPVVTSAPTVAEDRVFVGSRLFTQPVAGDIGYGFVSAMKPRRLLICDTDRLIETTGSKPSWVCTATMSPQRGQSFVGEDYRRPFSRPAKATRLPNGNILAVDTGSNRVVEIGEAGRVIWPLDAYGYEYYTSPDNNNLRLSRPADAHRYVLPGPEYHTVIADTGNARVIDVVTTVTGGVQSHVVFVKTPSAVRLSTDPKRYTRVRYTSAQPIVDPAEHVVIGYLCAAPNLNQVLVVENGSGVVNPQANAPTPSPSGATWKYWAWLYDEDPSDGNQRADNPLLFDSIKHVEYARYEGTVYVTVTCSRYRGRAADVAAGTLHPLAAAGPGVFEFRIDVSDLGDPTSWQLDQAVGGTDEPYWHFVGGSGGAPVSDGYWYAGGAARDMTHITTAAGTYRKRWYPACAKRLASGRHLIVNSISTMEHATHPNIAPGEADTPLGSHIFQVETTTGGDADPYNDLYVIPASRSVPEPNQPAWADPFNEPAYAELL